MKSEISSRSGFFFFLPVIDEEVFQHTVVSLLASALASLEDMCVCWWSGLYTSLEIVKF